MSMRRQRISGFVGRSARASSACSRAPCLLPRCRRRPFAAGAAAGALREYHGGSRARPRCGRVDGLLAAVRPHRPLSCSSAAKYVYGLVRTLSAGQRNDSRVSRR